jgi:hypothetical protein
VSRLLPGSPEVERLSIIPRTGGALGFTYSPPKAEDRALLFDREIRGQLVRGFWGWLRGCFVGWGGGCFVRVRCGVVRDQLGGCRPTRIQHPVYYSTRVFTGR